MRMSLFFLTTLTSQDLLDINDAKEIFSIEEEVTKLNKYTYLESEGIYLS